MSIYKKLFEAKKEIGKISKDSTNPFFKSKYFDINQLLEHVEPILQKHNLIVLQPILNNTVRTVIIDTENDDDKNNIVTSELELTNQTDPQKRGSEITYYRRYTLQSLLGLQAEDDDANLASKTQNKTSNNTPKDNELKWLNQFTTKEKTEVTRDFKRAVATLVGGKDMPYLRTKFKISNQVQQALEDAVNVPA